MAYFEKDKKGKWLVMFYCKDHKGNNKQIKKRGFSTKREAQEYVDKYISEFKGKDKEILFNNLLESFYNFRKDNLKKNTLDKYSLYTRTLKEYFDNVYLVDMKEIKIKNFLQQYNDRPQQQLRYKKYLSMVFDYAVLYHNYPTNIIKRIKLNTKIDKKEKEIWTVEGFKKFIDCLKVKYGHLKTYIPTNLYFNLLFFSGARPGEISGLTLQDIDYNNNTIKINKTRLDLNTTNSTKTTSSERVVSVPNNIMQSLKEYTDKLPNINDMFLFSTVKVYQNILIDTIKSNELSHITLHSFRHSHASLLIDKGLPITEISKRLGHKNPKITLEIYSHLYNKTKDNAIELLNNILE